MLAGVQVQSCEMPHGPTFSTAYRFDSDGKSLCYATDFSQVTEEMIELFSGTDILVVDCLRRDPHPTHANLSMALDLAKATQADKAVLTHLDKSMDYATLSAQVPDNVMVGYDGLELEA